MNKVKLCFCLFLFIISFLYMGKFVSDIDILSFILNDNKKETVFSAITGNNFNDPLRSLDVDEIVVSDEKENDEKKVSVSKTDTISKPIVYIFNTHETEEYAGSVYNITPTVKTVSDILKDELKSLGISAFSETKSITKEVNKRGLDYTGTYTVSFEYLKMRKKENPTLEYFFDMHRDSVTGEASRITIGGKRYAKMMFLVGTKNENYKKNVENLKIMEKYLNKYYPGLVRDTYYQKHSAFNQFYSEKMFLIELGGPDNTLEEIYNTSVALSKAIKYYVEESYEK